ncbi:MAG: restriction endonuclease subunit S [Ignavibacteriae bacterium]|nr:restriction endonuclease subunit S [Ignavibacteriota bacterium]
MKQGWEIKSIGEVCEIKPPKKIAKEKISDDDLVTFLPMADLEEFDYFITPTQAKKLKDVYSGYTYFENNDVLLAKITPCFENGKLGIAKNLKNGIGFGSSEYIVIRPNEEILSEYVYYYLSLDDIRRDGKKLMTGAVGHKRIPVDFIENQKIIVPSISEQKRIVAILGKAFEAIEKTKAHAEKNLKNSKELFESYLLSVFEHTNGDWKENYLHELGVITSSKRIYKNEYIEEGIPFYRTKEIKELANGKEISLELFISKEKYNEIKRKFGVPKVNDILMSAVGTIGEIMVVENEEEFYFKDGNIVWFKEFNSLNPNYLKFVLTAFIEKIKTLAIGAAYNALTIEKLKQYKISYPQSLTEQDAIVQELNTLSLKSKKLERIYEKKIEYLEELKKSLLHKAFSSGL